jgi:hypothetical protein
LYQRFVCEGNRLGMEAAEKMIKYLLHDRNLNKEGTKGIAREWFISFRVQELKDTIDMVCNFTENKTIKEESLFRTILWRLGLSS